VAAPDSARPAGVRALAGLGILGGLALLVAFFADLTPAQNTARLLMFLAGGVAVACAAYRPQARVSRHLALAGAIPLVLANGTLAAWIILSLERDRPFAGEFGLAGFYSGLALWLAHGWYGIVATRIGVMWRGATIILAAGSLLAIAGIDRLELTSPANPTVFGPLSQLGLALNGIAWILLSLQVVVPGAFSHHSAAAVPGVSRNV
jgi:hypothetical protein